MNRAMRRRAEREGQAALAIRPGLTLPAIAAAEPRFRVVAGKTLVSRVGGTFGVDRPANRPGEQIMFRWLPEETIPADLRTFVQGHVDRIAEALGLGAVAVRWFGVSSDGYGDFVYPAPRANMLPAAVTPDPSTGLGRCIGLNATVRGDRLLIGAIAHELRHHFQIALRELLLDNDHCEEEADRWAAAYLASEATE